VLDSVRIRFSVLQRFLQPVHICWIGVSCLHSHMTHRGWAASTATKRFGRRCLLPTSRAKLVHYYHYCIYLDNSLLLQPPIKYTMFTRKPHSAPMFIFGARSRTLQPHS
jgi:hypothetical protein